MCVCVCVLHTQEQLCVFMSTVCDSSIVFSPASEAGRTIEEDIADLNGSGVVLFALFECHEGPLIPLTRFTDVDTAASPERGAVSFRTRSISAEIQSANERHSGDTSHYRLW